MWSGPRLFNAAGSAELSPRRGLGRPRAWAALAARLHRSGGPAASASDSDDAVSTTRPTLSNTRRSSLTESYATRRLSAARTSLPARIAGLGGRVHADLVWAKLRTIVEDARLASTSLWP